MLAWVALAAAILIAGFLVRDRIDPSMLRPGGDTSGLPQIGQRAPDFSAINADGELVSLSDFEGQPVWLNFWGAWCPPCRAEIPDMIQAWDSFRGDGVALIAVSLEEPSSDAFEYAARVGMDFTVLSDPNREAIRGKYRVRAFPTHIFIDSNGIVREIVTTTMSTQTALNHVGRLN
jgi:cytochrome c biogenesis protein CcmG, thiol:disulfide interchange protein DsbE